ncbi:hypothetical protein LNP24_17455 [Klebsiella pneumoniae subsp. pneumoniae]|nr:hypothetical protein [Klebsiella pneumoniae subsp. pneumoniae]
MTKQDNTIEMASLESCIREDLNENAPARDGGDRSGETGYRGTIRRAKAKWW